MAHLESEVGSRLPVSEGGEDLFKGIHQFTLATICHSIAENGSSLAVVPFQNKKISEIFNYLPVRVAFTSSQVHLHLHLPSPFKVAQH